MRRRWLALIGVVSPLVLLLACVALLAVAGVAGWWLTNQDEDSRIIRIISLAPLQTPQPTQPAPETVDEAPAQPAEESPENAEGDASASEESAQGPEAEPEPTPAPLPSTPEEIAQARGFALPDGSVDAITQNGLANRLVIPKLKLDAPIVLSPIENQTWKVDHLGQAVGHLEGTAAPGSNSNVVLAGHITLAAGVYGPFAGLANLAPGDTIIVYDDNQPYEYIIDGYQIVERTAVEVTNPSNSGQITLITCSNWNHDEERYIDRLVVTGRLKG